MAFAATVVELFERGAVIMHEKLFTFIATYKQHHKNLYKLTVKD
jgi:hypothetical protein